ncbi:MAG: LysR family transcriptional regulator [Geodermatophilaceae bacterium]|nr:LysR family transcriptional regulator [Geodermatophilaceae bacterium]
MTPHQLRTFLAVVTTGSVGDAADMLLVSQSAVSASLSGLQRELGVRLIERHGRGVRLTEAGGIYAGYSQRILGLIDEALISARDGNRPQRGHVRLGAVPTAAEQVIPGYLATFRQHYPDAQVSLHVGSRDDVFRRLVSHEVDLVVAGRPPAGSPLVSRALADNELVLVAAPGLIPSGSVSAALAALAQATWLLREPGSGTRDTMLGYLADRELAPPQLTLGANGAVIAGAVAGLGVTLVSRSATVTEVSRGQLATIAAPGTPMVRPWHLVTREDIPAPTRICLDHLLDLPAAAGIARFIAENPPAGAAAAGRSERGPTGSYRRHGD